MIRVLLSAYACLPNYGTEPGHGWGWATQLAARGMAVRVLTPSENRPAIEDHLRSHPIPGLNFSYVPYTTERLKQHVGLRYLLWQFAAARAAKILLKTETFDIAHHVTYGSIHVPSQLWRTGLPVIFGPVGGGQMAPANMLHYFGAAKLKEQIRTAFTKSLPFSPLHRAWLRKMSMVLVSNRDTMTLAKSLSQSDVQFVFDTGLPESFLASQPRSFPDAPNPLRLLWVGRILPRKAIGLALDIVAKAKCPSTLTIIAGGIDQSEMNRMIAERGLAARVFFQPRRLPWHEVRTAYGNHDALLFTSLRETGGAQLLEAMASGLPVITLALHGARDLVPDAAGFKVPVTNSLQLITDAALAIDKYSSLTGQQRESMSQAALAFARTQTWTRRAEYAEGLYRAILSGQRAPQPNQCESESELYSAPLAR